MRGVLLALAALLTIGASTPPSFSVLPVTITDADTFAMVEVDKSAKASSYSTIKVSTVDGTAKAGVDYQPVSRSQTVANNTVALRIPVPIIARPGYQGPRTFTLHLAVTRYGTVRVADATITINDSEPAPPPSTTWTKCADEGGSCNAAGTVDVRYGKDPTWSPIFQQTGSFGCNNSLPGGDPLVGTAKECWISPATSPAPTPVPAPTGNWTATGGALQIGGYAFVKGSKQPDQDICCNGLIVKIVGRSYDANGLALDMWSIQYVADPSGNFPASVPGAIGHDYWTTAVGWSDSTRLIPVAPAN